MTSETRGTCCLCGKRRLLIGYCPQHTSRTICRGCFLNASTINRANDPAPNAWWREFGKALHHGLAQGWSAVRAEEYAKEMAELNHPNQKKARV